MRGWLSVSLLVIARHGSVCAVCYHFATQLDSTAQNENERDDDRALERPYILGRSNTRQTAGHRPSRITKPLLYR
jgi:hypothetical protein